MGSSSITAIRTALACAALAAACPAGAQMYKWVDDKGTVQYSNTPPPDTAQKKVAVVAERLSVYTPDPELNHALSAEGRREAKAASLGRQLESERLAHRTPPPQAETQARRNAAYERCLANRRVDCEAIRSGAGGEATYGYTGYYGPQYVIGSRGYPSSQPFRVLSTPASQIGISPAPPVGISTAPRVGIDDRPPVGAPPRSTRPVSRSR